MSCTWGRATFLRFALTTIMKNLEFKGKWHFFFQWGIMDKIKRIRINVLKKYHPSRHYNSVSQKVQYNNKIIVFYCYALDVRCLKRCKFKTKVYISFLDKLILHCNWYLNGHSCTEVVIYCIYSSLFDHVHACMIWNKVIVGVSLMCYSIAAI